MNFSRFIFLTSSSLFLSPALLSQNLVPNGSFEQYAACPGSYTEQGSEFGVESWRSLTRGTPDYFNTCSEGQAAVPYNWAGVSEAYDGNGYAGIYTWMNLPKEYREYLHCKLMEPLIRDSLYRIEFRYKLSSYSKFSTDRIGLLLSDSLKRFSHDNPLEIPPTLTFVKDSALTPETGAWETAAAEYRARGNERYLTIGNFADNRSTQHYPIRFRPESEPMLANSAYYYIDDVKVIPGFLSELPEEPPVLAGDSPELNKIYVLKNIQFEFNSYALMSVSYEDLNRVIVYLKDHPEISARLTGHTDDIGSYEYNLWLSDARAKSAAAYIIAQGVDEKRITTLGYGEGRPLVAGTAEGTREKNRRVEIEFMVR